MVVAVIPAKGTSKGIPRKNMEILGDMTLVGHAINVAEKSKIFTEIVVSTDDPKIQEEAIRFGASVPFLRPAHLSGDEVPTYPVIKHAVEFIERQKGYRFDFVMVLQPTAPFRKEQDLREALNILIKNNAPSLASVCPIVEPHPEKALRIIDGKIYSFITREKGIRLIRRQDTTPAYILNGAIYLSRREVIDKALLADEVIPYVMPPERSVNIDTMLDLEFARYLLAKQSRV